MTVQADLKQRRLDNLRRIMHTESANHPLIAEAVEANAHLIDLPKWTASRETQSAAEMFADAIESYVAYRGRALDHFICEPWLSQWRTTCWRALQKAQFELDRNLLPLSRQA